MGTKASKVEQHFDAILALVASGVPIIRALKSDPRFPVKPTWISFVFHPDFPERRKRLEAAQLAGKEGRSWTIYTEAQFDRSLGMVEASDLSIHLKHLKIGDGPSYSTLRYRAERDAVFAERLASAKSRRSYGGGHQKYSDDAYDRALLFLAQSASTAAYEATSRAKGLPCGRMLWVRSINDLAYGNRYGIALMKVAQHSRSHGHASERFTSSLLSNDLYRRVSSIVPKHLYPEAREDIISDMIEAVLAGRMVDAEIVSRCQEYVTRHNRLFSVFKMESLDVHVFDDDSMNVLDGLTTDPATSWGI